MANDKTDNSPGVIVSLDDHLEDLRDTSPTNRYIIARMINREHMLLKIMFVGPFEDIGPAFKERFSEFKGDGQGLIVQAAEVFEKYAEKCQ